MGNELAVMFLALVVIALIVSANVEQIRRERRPRPALPPAPKARRSHVSTFRVPPYDWQHQEADR